MKFYYNKDGELSQVNICCIEMTRHFFSYQNVYVETLYQNSISSSPLHYRNYPSSYIFFCPFCGRTIKRYGLTEKESQSRVESLMNLPSDTTETIPPLPSENSNVSTGAVGAVNSGFDSLEKIEHELEIEHANNKQNTK